jgi:hypothetical protein
VLARLAAGDGDSSTVIALVREMHRLDGEATRWRQRPEWSFTTVRVDSVEYPGYLGEIEHLPDFVQIHGDVWMAYEWNYHRTARIVLHQQLLACLDAVGPEGEFLHGQTAELIAWRETSTLVVRALADEVLSTVAQSFGHVDHLGRATGADGDADAPTTCQALGAYFMLWPVKIIQSKDGAATDVQKAAARGVYERIRECTGIKKSLSSPSNLANLQLT